MENNTIELNVKIDDKKTIDSYDEFFSPLNIDKFKRDIKIDSVLSPNKNINFPLNLNPISFSNFFVDELTIDSMVFTIKNNHIRNIKLHVPKKGIKDYLDKNIDFNIHQIFNKNDKLLKFALVKK